MIAVSTEDHEVKILDAKSFKTIASVRLAPKTVEQLCWSQDDRALIGWEGYGREVIVLGRHGEELRLVDSFVVPGKAGLKSFALGRSGGATALFLLFETETIVYDMKSTKKEIKRIATEKIRNNDLCVCSGGVDGNGVIYVTWATWDPNGIVWKAQHMGNGAWLFEHHTLLKGADDELLHCAAQHGTVATSSKDGRIYSFSLSPLSKWKHLGVEFSPSVIAVSPCGKVVAFASGTTVLISTRDGHSSLRKNVVRSDILQMSWSAESTSLIMVIADKNFFILRVV